jgi:hypothetical protein
VKDNEGIGKHDLLNSILFFEEEGLNLFWGVQVESISNVAPLEFVVKPTINDQVVLLVQGNEA